MKRTIATILSPVGLALLACVGCEDVPAAPLDYTNPAHWIALPDAEDVADHVPAGDGLDATTAAAWLVDRQATATADVFYVHPTSYIETFGVDNAPLSDRAARAGADEAVLYQASAFNAAGQIYAPRYRQASVITYAVDAGGRNARVLDAALADVTAAFDEFIRRTGDRPFILVGHSQGGAHLVDVITNRIDGQALQKRLVAAYIVGEIVGPDTFKSLDVCAGPHDVGCVVSWATVRDGATPQLACGSSEHSECIDYSVNTTAQKVTCVDPISWTAQGSSPASDHRGAGPGLGLGGQVLDGLTPGLVSTRCDKSGLLRIDDTITAGGITARQMADVDSGDYHVQDINLFWLDLRINAAERVGAWSLQ